MEKSRKNQADDGHAQREHCYSAKRLKFVLLRWVESTQIVRQHPSPYRETEEKGIPRIGAVPSKKEHNASKIYTCVDPKKDRSNPKTGLDVIHVSNADPKPA